MLKLKLPLRGSYLHLNSDQFENPSYWETSRWKLSQTSMAPIQATSSFGLNGRVPRAEQGMVLMVLSLKSLVKGSWQGKQFDYFASWTGVFFNWKPLKECEGWRWVVYINCGTNNVLLFPEKKREKTIQIEDRRVVINCSSIGCLKCVQFHNWFRLWH